MGKKTVNCTLCLKPKDIADMFNVNRCRDCIRRLAREHYHKNRERNLLNMSMYAERLKDAAYSHYGGYKCRCCGETEKKFLSIDHIAGQGTRHRKSLEGGGSYICRWLKKNNYPSGFQVLCMNCNFGKGRNKNICPHENQNQ